MQESSFYARCDVEIGDVVKSEYSEDLYVIWDIRTIHQLRDGHIWFEFKLKKDGNTTEWIRRDDFIYPVKEIGTDENRRGNPEKN